MPSDSKEGRREILALAADGAVVTGGAFAVMAGAAFGLEALGVPMGEPQGSGLTLVLTTVSWLLQVGGLVVGPFLAWRLNGRRFDKPAVIGLVAGYPLSGVMVMALAVLAPLVDRLVGFATDVRYAGAIAYLAVLVLAFAAAVAWVAARAVRDLSGGRRQVPLDVVRLLAALGSLAFWAVVVAMIVRGQDAIEAGAFLLLDAVVGAVTVSAAALAARFAAKRTDSPERMSA